MPSLDIRKLGGLFGKGLIPEIAPEIVKGLLIELFKSKKVDIRELSLWIEQDVSLWSKFDPHYQQQIKRFVGNMGNISWFTADWFVKGLSKDLPSLCSLFLGWKKAHNWLERQILEIKEQVQQTTA